MTQSSKPKSGGAGESFQRLVDLLRVASQLEHSLLDAYLYTACSLKSLPQEFAEVDDQPNRRRAIQFERVRAWKQSILNVSHEEMLHLHYVQCLIRALGESPYFGLPNRDDQTGNWIIPGWKARIGAEEVNEGKGVEVPVAPLTPSNIRHFVLYEAADSLQDQDPFGDESMEMFRRLHDFELDYRLESMLLTVKDEGQRAKLKEQLKNLYTSLSPIEAEAAPPEVEAELLKLPPVEKLTFQSIGDFYYQGVLPLYQEAYDFGWVTETNRKLNNEIGYPDTPAAEGFLPVGPIKRDKNFEQQATANVQDPLRDFMRVEDIIDEIVEEGEGMAGFEDLARQLLERVDKPGGAREYLEAVLADARSSDPTPQWLQDGQLLRESHLYRFAMIMVELDREIELARQCGVEFDPSRDPQASVSQMDPSLKRMADELPAQFNACYLVLLAWLSRMYEIKHWEADKPRRIAIEMLASWPLMSMAIRPFLELASHLPVDLPRMFRIASDSLPMLPLHAQQLYELYSGSTRTEEINDLMDYYAVRVLEDVAEWASTTRKTVAEASGLDDTARQMMLTRLEALSTLREFKKQFPFRVAGGYSANLPARGYVQDHPGGSQYSENPANIDPSAAQPPTIFRDGLALRLRFGGSGLVQLATDPDPTYDESGCTGTQMLHASDTDRTFDRALVWQDRQGNVIRRGPDGLPPLGVNCTEIALMSVQGSAQVGYVPLGVMSSTGAVQTSGVQQQLKVGGFAEVDRLTPAQIMGGDRKIRIDLLRKDGSVPFLNGLNHVIWQDGEPIDPFILSVSADADDGGADRLSLFRREIYNEGTSVFEMEPLQRTLSSRAPVGFDSVGNIPAWARTALPPGLLKAMQEPSYPINYLNARAGLLIEALSKALDRQSRSRELVDEIVSLAERTRLVSVPKSTTTGWLFALLHYGHSVSGALSFEASKNPLLDALEERTGIKLQVTTGDRTQSNTRWLMSYTLGAMDVDALSSFVYGELYIPLEMGEDQGPITRAKTWSFPDPIRSAVVDYACRFDKPFWATFNVQGNKRSTRLADGTLITETLVHQGDSGYEYKLSGLSDVTNYTGSFKVSGGESGRVSLTWSVTFEAGTEPALLGVLDTLDGAGSAMGSALREHFVAD